MVLHRSADAAAGADAASLTRADVGRWTVWDAGAALAIVVVVALMGGRAIGEGGLGWSDAPQHTFNGVFILEFLRQLPLDAPRAWAEAFYLRFPAIGLVVYWPPGYGAIEAAVFAVSGVGIVTARLVVLLFAVGSGWWVYVLGRRWFDRPTGVLAALLLLTCAHGVLWMNDVLLEWPATFWILLAVYCYERDRAGGRWWWAVLLGAAWVTAFMIKQTAGFIVPVLLVHAALAGSRRGYFFRPALIVGLGLAVLIIGGYSLLARPYARLSGQLLAVSVEPLFYVRALPGVVGWPLALLGGAGLAAWLLDVRRPGVMLLLLWFVAWAGFSSVIAAKEPRYFFYALAPLVFAAVDLVRRAPQVLGVVAGPARWAGSGVALLAALIGVQAWAAWPVAGQRLPRYAPAVAELAARQDADLVLVDAVRDGQFVFDVYQSAAARGRIVPLRASKLLYARRSRVKWGYEAFVENEADIVALLERYGIRYVVIESRLPATHYTDADPPPRKMLRGLLENDARFELVGAWPLACGDRAWADVELRLYAYPGCPARATDMITLSIPAMGREVTFDLSRSPLAWE